MDMFINIGKNDKFTSFTERDLKDVLNIIDNFYLEYRDSLKLEEIVSFAPEIEYEDIEKVVVDQYVEKYLKGWLSNQDNDLGEINSYVLYDDKKVWTELKRICEYLKQIEAKTNKKAACHIHVGAHVLGEDLSTWRQYLKLYLCYEPVHFRFATGDKIAARYHVLSHAQSVRADIAFILNRLNKDRKNNIGAYRLLLPHGKNKAINFGNVAFHDILNKNIKNTVENRIYNATIEEVIIQNNINTSTKMLLAPTKGLIDEEYLDYKIEKMMQNDWISEIDHSYYKIRMQDALEFVDFIFDNNLDKVYFLRQYLKNYQEVSIALQGQRVEKAKRFIK